MIANITTGNYTHGMVKYNHDKINEKNSLGEKAIYLGEKNIHSNEVNDIIKRIVLQNNLNSNISKPNIHISLNFHKNDVLNNNKVFKIAEDYMERLGYSDQPYAVYRHFDKEHPHIHIVSSQIDNDKKKISDSFLYRKSQRITRELELLHGITVATEHKGNKIENIPIDKLIHEHLEKGKFSLSSVLSEVILNALSTKPTNEKEFDYALLKNQCKRSYYFEENETKGNYFHLIRIEDLSEPEIKDKGIKGSQIDFSFSYEAIQTQLALNDKVKKQNFKPVMGKVYAIVNEVKNLKEPTQYSLLEMKLRKKGIEMTTRRKQTGDDIGTIYGLLFKDMKTGMTYSASDFKIKTKEFLSKIIDDETKMVSKDDPLEYHTKPKDTPNDFIQTDKIYGSSNLLEAILVPVDSHMEVQELDPNRKKKRKRNR